MSAESAVATVSVDVNQPILLYLLNFCSRVCRLFLSKTGGTRQKEKRFPCVVASQFSDHRLIHIYMTVCVCSCSITIASFCVA